MVKTKKSGMSVGAIRKRADKWFDWDEVHVIMDGRYYALELGLSNDDPDWTSVEMFWPFLFGLDDAETFRFNCEGKEVVVTSIDDRGEPFLTVKAV